MNITVNRTNETFIGVDPQLAAILVSCGLVTAKLAARAINDSLISCTYGDVRTAWKVLFPDTLPSAGQRTQNKVAKLLHVSSSERTVMMCNQPHDPLFSNMVRTARNDLRRQRGQ